MLENFKKLVASNQRLIMNSPFIFKCCVVVNGLREKNDEKLHMVGTSDDHQDPLHHFYTIMKLSPAFILIGSSAGSSTNDVAVREINEECDPQWKPVRVPRT